MVTVDVLITVFSHCHRNCRDLNLVSTNNKSQLYHTDIHVQVVFAFND